MIDLKALTVRYGALIALDRIDLNIQAGESVAIVGESGAGKSTIAKVLLGLVRATDGTYQFDGVDVSKLTGKALIAWRRKVQAVLQNPTASLNSRVRIDVSVTEPITARERMSKYEVRQRAEDLLESVGLDRGLASRYPSQLSGGQRQRVVIARALGVAPEMVLLDEPVSALDASARAQILNLLADLKTKSNVTTVYITHDLATVGYLCERIVVLFAGQIVEDLRLDQLLERPDHPYTQALTAASIVPATDFSSKGTEFTDPGEGCPFASQCPSAQTICLGTMPDLVEIQAGWHSRCHFAGQTKPENPIT